MPSDSVAPPHAPALSEVIQQPELRTAVLGQMKKLEADTDKTSASNFTIAQGWENINLRLGLATVALSGAVTILGSVSSFDHIHGGKIGIDTDTVVVITALLTAAVTVCGSVLTFLKPAERAARYREFGNKGKSLRNRLRIYSAVTCLHVKSDAELLADLLRFSRERDALASDNPPIALSDFRKAMGILEDTRRMYGSGNDGASATRGKFPESRLLTRLRRAYRALRGLP